MRTQSGRSFPTFPMSNRWRYADARLTPCPPAPKWADRLTISPLAHSSVSVTNKHSNHVPLSVSAVSVTIRSFQPSITDLSPVINGWFSANRTIPRGSRLIASPKLVPILPRNLLRFKGIVCLLLKLQIIGRGSVVVKTRLCRSGALCLPKGDMKSCSDPIKDLTKAQEPGSSTAANQEVGGSRNPHD